MKQSIIVTGGSGFVGNAIARHFAGRTSVTSLDCAPPKNAVAGVNFVEFNLPDSPPDSLAKSNMDVIHCAAVMRAPDEETFWRINVEGTRRVLEWAVRHRARSFTFFSTGGVYGYSDGECLTEDAPIKPVGIYGHTKWIGEQVCRMAAMEHGLPVTVFRLYFPYGSNQNSGIFAFIDRAVAEGREMTVQKDGAPSFRPTHVEDIAEAVRIGMETTAAREPFRVFNLCGDDETSFLDLVQRFEGKHGRKAVFTHLPEKQGDLLADNARLKLATGWRPQHSVSDIF